MFNIKNSRFITIIAIIFLFLGGIAKAKISLENRIIGVDRILLENIKTALQTKQENQQKLNESRIQEFTVEAEQTIKNTLETFGYFKAKITSRIENKKNKWIGTYNISTGEQLKITNLNLKIIGEGLEDENLMQALKNFPLKKGDALETAKYNTAKQFLFDQANNFGYINSTFEKKVIKINLANYTSNITLEFNTGKLYLFGPPIFSKNAFSTNFLKRYVPFKVGETYSAKKIMELQDALTNSNYFDQVTITPQITEKNIRPVPIKIDLVARKAKQYNFGIGYGTDTGARGLFGIELRQLTSNGQTFKGLLKISEVQNNLETHYLIPGPNPTTDQFDISAAGQTQDIDYGKSQTLQVAGGYITTIKGWNQTIKFILQHENYEYTTGYTNNTTLLLPSFNWSHSNTDQYLKPTRGHSINFNVLGSSKFLLAKEDFLQSQLSAKYLIPFAGGNEILLRANLGYTVIDNLSKLPLSMQFFTGGAQSIRGYSYNSIGPGKALTVGSVELRHKIISDWYAGIFYDAGQASNSFFNDIKQGIGAGITWKTMIGPISVSYAKALDLPNRPNKLQFSIGPEF